MPLKPKTVGIVRAEVIPWEADQRQFGVAYTLTTGQEGATLVGTREQAEATLREILAENPSSDAATFPFPKDTAAS
jgi:hypothetical protein